ncbi:uncharacterized protein LOC103578788 [Microplitis demolitor]|uniref:uncharacterized protein LOC103578788 n=1 Tax=Microplitis demolitor TaxID=69319 RepID=UPI0004CDC7B7|nr:uncharacterized protein LOC103578788 [Microplitis demolitor]
MAIISSIWLVAVTATSVPVESDKISPLKTSEDLPETAKEKRYFVHSHSPTPCPPFYPHYHAPMSQIHYSKPVYGPPAHPKPIYGPPMHPKPVYVVPEYQKPVYKVPEYQKPVYKVPEYPKPVYGPPMHHKPVQLIHQPTYQSYVPQQTVSYIKPHVSKPDYHYLPSYPKHIDYEKPLFAYAPSYHQPMKSEYLNDYNTHQKYHTPSHYFSKPGIVYKESPKCEPCHDSYKHHESYKYQESYHHHEPQVIHVPPPSYIKPQVHYLPTHSYKSPIVKHLGHPAPCP